MQECMGFLQSHGEGSCLISCLFRFVLHIRPNNGLVDIRTEEIRGAHLAESLDDLVAVRRSNLPEAK